MMQARNRNKRARNNRAPKNRRARRAPRRQYRPKTKNLQFNQGPMTRSVMTAPVNTGRVFSNRTSSAFRIYHSEIIIPRVDSGTEYNVTQQVINPGLSGAFPWLSSMAPLFEKYTFEMLRFVFTPFANTSQTGSILMSFDFDPSDPAPPNLSEFTTNIPSMVISS